MSKIPNKGILDSKEVYPPHLLDFDFKERVPMENAKETAFECHWISR